MDEYIVEFDKTQYDEAVADGILKDTDNPTLYGMPMRGKIIRCRDCKHYEKVFTKCKNERWNTIVCGAYLTPCVEPDGFCAWAERRQ